MPETGFAFLAALLPWLASSASEVIGGALSAGGFLAVQAAMSPRSEDEQQVALARAEDYLTRWQSANKWLGAAAALRHPLDQGLIAGADAFEARAMLDRLTAFLLTLEHTDIEREAAFTAVRLRIDDMARKADATPHKPRTRPEAPVTPDVAGPVPTSAPAGGPSPGGSFPWLAVAGVALVAGGAWYALRRKRGAK